MAPDTNTKATPPGVPSSVHTATIALDEFELSHMLAHFNGEPTGRLLVDTLFDELFENPPQDGFTPEHLAGCMYRTLQVVCASRQDKYASRAVFALVMSNVLHPVHKVLLARTSQPFRQAYELSLNACKTSSQP